MERNLKTGKVAGVKPRDVYFRFFPNGNSTTAMTSVAGDLWDPGSVVSNVAQASDGIFLVTMRDPSFRVVFIDAQVQLAANNVDLQAEVGAITTPTDGTGVSFYIKTMTGTTPTVIASNTNNSVMVHVHIEDSTAAGVP